MGLDLSVGQIADLLENDSDSAERMRVDFARLNEFLRSEGLPVHTEPENVMPFSCQMWGYGGLHYLRRVAAHLEFRGTLPPPGDERASHDPVLARYYAADPERRGLLGRAFRRFGRRLSFDHFIQHSDADGYYLPQDFADVLVASAEWQIAGGYIGSSIRLRAECEKLAAALELPRNLDPESEDVWSAPDDQGSDAITWRRYGIESFTCVRLLAAADHSIKTGAAIVFC